MNLLSSKHNYKSLTKYVKELFKGTEKQPTQARSEEPHSLRKGKGNNRRSTFTPVFSLKMLGIHSAGEASPHRKQQSCLADIDTGVQ